MEETKKSRNPIIIGLLIVAVILVISRLSNSGKAIRPEIESVVSPTPTTEQTPTTMVDVGNGQITIEAGSFYFTPNLIRVKKGEKIKLILKANDLMHDFNIDELGVKVPVTKAGNSSIVEFTADKAGEFEYYCSIGEHRQRGQVGKLIVIE
ncbi:hypothetical protein A3K29_02395 [Candidatus Collierbacteria bacterium RIFOXYB2_FULL_46_14]|uniref:Plastocyanin n=1 Tax=Candidatus Collierbacteria bacterium GW2011_GWA2_46_26 TaxID=1618381 RepID=A0A0G1RRA8_9BACT|nr:MAG: Plastocyanin [Candidatus Collierbacteria bacterium GW2011_GWC2_44_13]KKU32498.1 MAG: Plastocyanin [Candidatus Collierbacteria bacterium GW2011_GWA2_46_26]OGD72973.1 MAG: hypothetical protein A3K29_02395 [Candidatus Collierbacteria bacterium RIFOXYB2_FULL_46_14]OGD76015.1 MAG: hypothetical protein A3K43_02395 [Candidatus Collierbacteria bacterium RIFOXYA2_FULL_46_20]OGD77351.1 MAG: hypothetical protein A3K39_02395 [Candidatus Collierbacteria bacterium RIFOXYC2_FULL_43_15]OGD80641.1 MAG: